MMKRTLFLPILLLLLLLAGCGAERPAETPVPTEAPAAAEPAAAAPASEPPTWDYPAADTAAMSSYMSANRALIAEGRLYGLDYDDELRPVLASWLLRGGRPTSRRILCEDCVPEYLALEGKFLYYLNGGALQRLPLKGRAPETLLEGPIRSLQIHEGALYYTDAEGRWCRADLDGRNAEVLIEGPCDYAWAMPEGVVYQSEGEGCCLRLRNWDGTDRRLTAAAGYAPLRVGGTLWYSQRDGEGSVLASVDLRDGTVTRYETADLRGAAELVPAGDEWLLRVFLAGDGWKQQLLRPGETEGEPCAYSGYRLCDFVGEDCRIDAAYDPDGRLRCFVLVDADGGELRYFGGKILD